VHFAEARRNERSTMTRFADDGEQPIGGEELWQQIVLNIARDARSPVPSRLTTKVPSRARRHLKRDAAAVGRRRGRVRAPVQSEGRRACSVGVSADMTRFSLAIGVRTRSSGRLPKTTARSR
jgi:hypothetical protein